MCGKINADQKTNWNCLNKYYKFKWLPVQKNNKLFWGLLLILSFFNIQVKAQQLFLKDVITDKQLLDYVFEDNYDNSKYYKRKNFGFTLKADKDNNFDKKIVTYFNQKPFSHFIKIDLNKDAVKDMVCYFNTESTSVTDVSIFISSGDSFLIKKLTVPSENTYCPYSLLPYNDSMFILAKCLIHKNNSYPPIESKKTFEQYFRYDTLQYKFGNFINNQEERNYKKVDSIRWYSEHGGFSVGTGNAFKQGDLVLGLKIDQKANATIGYYKNKKIIIFGSIEKFIDAGSTQFTISATGKNNVDSNKIMMNLASYLYLPFNNNISLDLGIPLMDAGIETITIYYHDGTFKSINQPGGDNGLGGSYSAQLLFKMFRNMKILDHPMWVKKQM